MLTEDNRVAIVLSEELERRFWAKVKKSDGCWEWTASRQKNGYGSIALPRRDSGRMARAHRVSWMIAHGPIADGLQVCHRCDNPPCVRPDHLFLGTRAVNMADCVAKGRLNSARGERASKAKLTAEKVNEIRARLARGATDQGLATEYGVSDTSIRMIRLGWTWRHLL